ncbi:MAG: Na/Pi symporter [Porticoccaceae bacterium]|nr:Na/Pi symporter [Porticoccaceae bacterium]
MQQFWELLAGLGIFIYAMRVLENGLRGISTRSLRKILRQQTKSPGRGVVIGALTTAFLQSSSLVSLIVVAFVGASILPLQNALGVIFGANLGTTATGWLVTAIGFKLDTENYTLGIIALGSLGYVVSKAGSRYHHRFAILLGIGLLLMGLMWMKSSMAFVGNQVDPALFRDYPLVVYFIAGVIFTALVQSSSATMVIILSGVFAEVIPLTTAAALVVGSDLGTTSTVLLGSLRASNSARRVALAHFTFNLSVGSLTLIFLVPLLALITEVFAIHDPMYALVCFHSTFNLLGVLVFLPFTKAFANWLDRRFRKLPRHRSRLAMAPPNVPEAALSAIHAEAMDLCIKAILLNIRALKVNTPTLLNGSRTSAINEQLSAHSPSYEEQYQDIKTNEEQVLQYSHRLARLTLTPAEQALLSTLLDAVREASYSAKSLKDIRNNLLDLRNQIDSAGLLTEIRNREASLYQALITMLEEPHPEISDEQISRIRAESAESHDQLHQYMANYSRNQHCELSLPTLFNINRELFVSNQSLTDAIALLGTCGDITPAMGNSD